MAVVAGVDSSTQSTKVEICDADSGAVLGVGRASHPATTPPCSEQDPHSWWNAFESAYAQACAAAGVTSVDAISVAGQQHGMVVLDSDGAVIRPAKLWNDTQSAPDAGWLLKQRTAQQWADACGSVPVAAFTISKLSWLHRSEPEAWARVAHVMLPHDWMTLQLTGRYTTDRGDASGTGYWSPTTGHYCWDLLSIIDSSMDWTSVVPEVLGPNATAGTWNGAVVAAGTGDNMAAALGLCLGAGDVAISLGTSGTAYGIATTPTSDASGEVAGFADATGRYLPLACTLNATKVIDAVRTLLGVDHETFDALAMSAADGGPVLLPYFDGERTPNRPGASGALIGVRSDVTREQLARAAIDGVVCGMLDAFDALVAAGLVASGALHLIGGGARSSAMRQRMADVSGRVVSSQPDAEHVARGAAMQASAVWRGVDVTEIVADWELVGAVTVTEPALSSDAASDIRMAYGALRDRWA
jgi:xylulokinase